MGVYLDPNPQKVKVHIDMYGNIVKPFTKEVIVPKATEYVPTTEQIEAAQKKSQEPKSPSFPEVGQIDTTTAVNPLQEAIKKQVQEQVQKTLK